MTNFFDESQEQSRVKAEIVAKYFWAWAKVILPTAKRHNVNMAYIDLFAGPGRYKDGAKSTPLLVLERALTDEELCRRLITIFNDADQRNTQDLEGAISTLEGIGSLVHKPLVRNSEVGREIVQMFTQMRLVPTLFFVDPWGYKGLSLQLIGSVLKDWGCDCIFFFNYNRINMGLTNELVKEHMDALFGEEKANNLRKILQDKKPHEREVIILEAISQALKDLGGQFVLPFTFKRENGERTSHHLIFVTKHIKGYEVMKDIMAKQSSGSQQGVPSFEYSPASEAQPLLFELTKPLEQLEEILLEKYQSRTLRMREIYDGHHVGTRFIKANYKETLRSMEEKGLVNAEPSAENRVMRNGVRTFADDVRVSFPKMSNDRP
ncbi:MAG TPA: three-Cys-motif partner protein TcmP [Anaerolineales bacterium]|nr:three-Cys-motif partner protein TcmP [Anaerolineales bacterium]HRQ93370.1 three-Cys-motif partner protein TcmP [Anaerolineales bacterium]